MAGAQSALAEGSEREGGGVRKVPGLGYARRNGAAWRELLVHGVSIMGLRGP